MADILSRPKGYCGSRLLGNADWLQIPYHVVMASAARALHRDPADAAGRTGRGSGGWRTSVCGSSCNGSYFAARSAAIMSSMVIRIR